VEYADAKEFTQDVHLMFENARTYNPEGHYVHILADRLEKSFEEQMAKIHSRRVSVAPAISSGSGSSSQLAVSSKSASRPGSGGSKRSRPSQSVSSDSSSSSAESSSSDSSDDSDDDHRKRKQKHHGRHHHHHHHHGKKSDRAKKRAKISSATSEYEESIRRAELEKLQNEIRLLRNQLLEQKRSKAKDAAAARVERAAAAAARRASKSTSKRPPLSFDTTPDPNRPVTEEDKRRISGNINRLPPERMLPLVSFVQDQIPALCLVVPGRPPVIPSEIEVDLDTLDNPTLRTVDHKVRQALALAGQARRRAERRLFEQRMQKEQQLRHHGSLPMEQQQQRAQAKSLYQAQGFTSQQAAMNYVYSYSMQQRSMISPTGTPGFGQDSSMPGTPASAQGAQPEEEEEEEEEEEAVENEITPNIHSDSDSSSSSSSSSDSEDDMVPETYAPPPSLVPGAGTAAPVSLSQATAISSGASTGATS